MSKKNHFNIIMAGLISGIVALTTATLGLTGTVIGSVLSSIIYQALSTYSESRLENKEFKKYNIGGEIVYLLPLIVITIIELIFVLATFHYDFVQIFNMLETATNQNLFRVMGLGMIVLSFYPFLNSNNIPKRNGVLVFFTGGILLARGLVDLNNTMLIGSKLFFLADKVLDKLDFWIALIILLLLLIIIVGVLSSIFRSRDEEPKVYRNGDYMPRRAQYYDPLDFDELEMAETRNQHYNNEVRNNSQSNYYPRKKVIRNNGYGESEYESKKSLAINSGKTLNASNKTTKFFNNKFGDKKN